MSSPRRLVETSAAARVEALHQTYPVGKSGAIDWHQNGATYAREAGWPRGMKPDPVSHSNAEPGGSADKRAASNEYDGSLWYHRPRGELAAQCDTKEMNILALNVAHDIVTGRRMVADARREYAERATAFTSRRTALLKRFARSCTR